MDPPGGQGAGAQPVGSGFPVLPVPISPLFQETLRSAGINKYLFEMANIREHCSWVHMQEPEKGTRKARYLVKMAIEKARLLQPLAEGESDVIPRGLVLGGGIAGLNAALALARSGFSVYLVEKEQELGGLARNIKISQKGEDVQAYLNDLIDQVEREELISVFKGYKVDEIGGFVGMFNTRISDPEGRESLLEHGIIIVATGGRDHVPEGYQFRRDRASSPSGNWRSGWRRKIPRLRAT